MATYHIFHGTTGTAVMVTDDRMCKKLPKHPVGRWVYSSAATRLGSGLRQTT
jgi:hypothetical protein